VISRVTLWLGMAAVMIPLGIALWSTGRRDPCSRYQRGDTSEPATQLVETAGRAIAVPCSQWLPRQPQAVQLLCLVEGVVVLVLGLNLLGDVVDRRKAGALGRGRQR
jgi:hypothetical protein